MSHLSKQQIESLGSQLAQAGLLESVHHLLLCGPCRNRAALQLLDQEEIWKDGPSAFSERVLRRAAAILRERYPRAREERAAADQLKALRTEAAIEEVPGDEARATAILEKLLR